MKLKDCPKWVKENIGVEPTYWNIYALYKAGKLEGYKLGHKSVDVSPMALRACFKKCKQPRN